MHPLIASYHQNISNRIAGTDSTKELLEILKYINYISSTGIGDSFDATCRNIDRHTVYKKLKANFLTMEEIQKRSSL